MTIGNTDDTLHGVADSAGVLPWIVLVVDDEPEILQVTELVLGDTHFRGRPLQILGASSAAQARQLLRDRADTALVLLDVVMESDDAGLALTEFIREELGDDDIQIILRTGQPGRAPEQDVILRYDINGYFLKTEITAQKLRSVVIGALRNYGYLKKLRCRGTAEPDDGASFTTFHPREPSPGNVPDVEDGGRVLAADPVVRLQDHTWGAVQLSVGRSVHRRPNDCRASDSNPVMSAPDDDTTHVDAAVDRMTAQGAPRTLPFDARMLSEACRLAAQIQLRDRPAVDIIVPIASSGAQLAMIPGMLDVWLKHFDVSADRLVLEIRESAMMLDQECENGIIEELVTRGVRISLVHSAVSIISIRRLRDIRPSMLKIPHALVRELSGNTSGATLVRAIIALAHTLDMCAIAEGVSTQSELEFLRWEGCDLALGPLVSSSLPGTEALRLFGTPTDSASTH